MDDASSQARAAGRTEQGSRPGVDDAQPAVTGAAASQYIRDRLRDAGIALRPAGSQGTKPIHLDRDTLTAMLGQGMTVAAIADRAGYGRGGVHKLLRKYGLPSPGRARVTDVAADPLVALRI